MKKFSEQLHKKATTVKLRAAEKRELKERLVSYMEYHPLPSNLKNDQVLEKQGSSQVKTDPFTEWAIPFQAIFKYTGVMAVLVLVLIPFMAERAMPGDALYAVKVQFNEEVRGTLTFDAFKKVEWETERLNRRIAEARLLANEGRLTAEAEADVADAVREHSANAKREIAALREQDIDAATIASISLDTVLEFQSDSLRRSANDKEEATMALMAAIEEEPDLISLAIEEAMLAKDGNSSSSLPSYEGMVARVEQNTTRIFQLISSLEEELSEEQRKEVLRRSEDIDRMFVKATETKAEDEYLARVELLQTLQKTQRFIVFMTELDVFNSTDIDDLIPVVLTEAEEVNQRAELNNEITRQLAKVDALLPLVEEDSLVEKLQIARDSVDEQMDKSSTTENYREFVDYAQSTLAAISDMMLLISQSEAEINLPTASSTAAENEDIDIVEDTGTTSTSTNSTTPDEESIETASSSEEVSFEMELDSEEVSTSSENTQE